MSICDDPFLTSTVYCCVFICLSYQIFNGTTPRPIVCVGEYTVNKVIDVKRILFRSIIDSFHFFSLITSTKEILFSSALVSFVR